MRQRRTIGGITIAVVAVVAAVFVSALSASSKANTLTVWLQQDAQNNPDWWKMVQDTNAAFEKSHSGWKVNVEIQQWPTHLAKLDATLASGNVPDVVEMGNSELQQYLVANAFTPLPKARFDNNRQWLTSLAAAGTYNGQLLAAPYYAGSRVLTYRSDVFRSIPNTSTKLGALAKKVGQQAKFKRKNFSPIYTAGSDWYTGLAWVFDVGGQVAVQKRGKWVGMLTSKKSLQGLRTYATFWKNSSRARPASLENDPNPYEVVAQGNSGGFIGPAWANCCVGDFRNVTKQAIMPGIKAGRQLPGFLGGSNMAVTAKSNAKEAGFDWLVLFLSTENEKKLQSFGNVPNATNLLNKNNLSDKAAERSYFVPTAARWGRVEQLNILRNMFTQINGGQLSVAKAAQIANANIQSTLNA